METQNVSACNINGETLLGEVFLSTTQSQRHSHRTDAYTDKEEKCFVSLDCILEPILFAVPIKRECHFEEVILNFCEHRKFMPENLGSDRNYTSLKTRWSIIQSECNHFCGAVEHVTMRKLSGQGVGDLVRSPPSVFIEWEYVWSDVCMTNEFLSTT
jgi:hypothetical protein